MKKKSISIRLICGLILIAICCGLYFFPYSTATSEKPYPAPTRGETEIFAGQEEGGNAREEWQKLIHRAAPGTDWETIESENRKEIFRKRNANVAAQRSAETFANGLLSGSWQELGSNDQAGNLTTVRYAKEEDKIYGISGGGTLWRGNLDGSSWTELNRSTVFRSNILEIVEGSNGSNTIVAAIDKDLYYSTDNGASWTASVMDINTVQNWGEPTELVSLPDNSLIYLRRAWDPAPWAPRMWIYRSTDLGQNFTRIGVLDPVGTGWVSSSETQLWVQPGASTVYVLHQGEELYSVNGATVMLETTNNDLPTGNSLDLDGNTNGGITTLYALINQNTLYQSNNLGATWSQVSGLPVSSWSVGIAVSPNDPDFIAYGEVELYRTANGGGNWSKVNTWQSYYSDWDKVHADIMDIQFFEKNDGTDFILVANHGGLHVSYDNLVTTTNIGTSGLNIGQFYDVRTDPLNSNYVYGGTQDQGHQRTSVAAGATGPVNFDQVISGDYGHMAFSRNNQSLWTVYPGGWTTYYHNPQTSGYNAAFDVPGNHPPVTNWIFPTAETTDPDDNKIYIAGGNVNGGNGSYLVTLSAQTSAPYSISASQFNYDFRANSSSGTATISAIEASTIEADNLYVATSDGTFFYSDDLGATWNKTTNFGGPTEHWLYGSTIFASQLTAGLVWYAGSGYSNPSVYQSTDGGQTFTNISNGMPATLVHEIVANTDETLLFAATEAGPFVYVISEQTWYQMLGTIAPVQNFYSAEYVVSDNLVRFGTYGRGIWDFKITSQSLPVELASFEAKNIDNKQVRLDWITLSETNNQRFDVQKSADGRSFETIKTVNGQGTSSTEKVYTAMDAEPLPGINYYRLQQVDFNGQSEYSEIRSVKLENSNPEIIVYPNPVNAGDEFTVLNFNENMMISIFDVNGKVLLQQRPDNGSISTANLPVGHYYYQISNIQNSEPLKVGQLIVQ